MTEALREGTRRRLVSTGSDSTRHSSKKLERQKWTR